ncbi:hypothetical protein O0L34_g6490 [Tuta absoluta]|nr:hypothetical protein O0L34_g6490 [Tuta absoluta]
MVKKVVIFGANGKTGLCATEAAVQKGLQVRAFVRDPKKLPASLADKVEVFKGNVLEPDSVNDAIEGMDAVVICLGPGNSYEPPTDMSMGTKHIIDSMLQKNVKLVSACLAGFLFHAPEKIPPSFKALNEEHTRMYQYLRNSNLNYIAAWPPHITDEPSHEVIIEVNPTKSPGQCISKYDLGKFLVDSLDDSKYYMTFVGIANKP